ncbi:MAG TPA: hypothetical protein VGX28_14135 [Frankiaceae bacterium]|jgi:hypothetical protein|nr:hypothetical protein [Frankiaceae bacterium]
MSLTRPKAAAAGAIALALAGGYLAQGTFAAGIPANKVAASGSETEVIGANNTVLLLSETVKINNPTDLIISASAECSIITQVKTTDELARAIGRVTMWVTINGKHVPVSRADSDQGRVVYCDRVHEQESNLGGDEADENDNFVRTYLNTRTANSFDWLALNVGTEYGGTTDNVHKIELWAQFETEEVGNAMAQAAVGNRTLVLEPVKAAVGEQVVEVG